MRITSIIPLHHELAFDVINNNGTKFSFNLSGITNGVTTAELSRFAAFCAGMKIGCINDTDELIGMPYPQGFWKRLTRASEFYGIPVPVAMQITS